MSKIRLFRGMTLALFFLVLLSAASHSLLFVSDNPDFRYWVLVQAGLHIFAAVLLLLVRNFSFYALLSVMLVSIFIIHIDTRYLDFFVPAIGFAISWVAYAVVIKGVWSQFFDSPGGAT